MKLINLESGIFEELSEDQVTDAVKSGLYSFPVDEQVTIVSPNGEFGYADGQTALDLLLDETSGYRFQSEESRRRDNLEREAESATGVAKTAAEGALRGLTFGLSDPVLANSISSPEAMQARREANPITSIVSEVTGALAPLPTKALAPLKVIGAPSRAVDKIGRTAQAGVTKALRGASPSTARVMGGVARGAAEGGLVGVQQTITEASLGDAEFNAEALIPNIAKGAFFGAGAGAVFGLTSEKIRKSAIQAKRDAADEIKKAVGAPTGGSPSGGDFDTTTILKQTRPDVAPSKVAKFDLDAETGNYVYRDKTKTVEVNLGEAQLKVFSLRDPSIQDEISEILNIPDLGARIDSTSFIDDPIEYLVQTASDYKLEQSSNLTGKEIPALSASLAKKKGSLEKQLAGLQRVQAETTELQRKLSLGDFSVKKRLADRQAKMGELLKDYKKSKTSFNQSLQEYTNKKASGVEAFNENAVFNQVNDYIDTYDAYLNGKNLFVKNTEALSGGGVSSLGNVKKVIENFSVSEKAILRLLDAKSGDVLRNNPTRLKEVIGHVQGILGKGEGLSRKNLMGIDDIAAQNELILNSASDTLENTVIQMINYVDRSGLGVGVNRNKLIGELNSLSRSLVSGGEGGKLGFGQMPAVQEIEKIRQEIMRATEDLGGKNPSLNMGQVRELKQYIQSKVKWAKLPENSATIGDIQPILKSYQSFLNEEIVFQASKFEGSKPLVATFLKANKDISLSLTTGKMIQKALAKEATRKGISFGDLITGSVGFGIGTPFALAGLAAKKGYEQYGQNIVGLYGDTILNKAAKLNKSISSSAKGFMSLEGASPVRPFVMGAYTITDYNKDKKKLESGYLGVENLNETFLRQNEAMISELPQTASILQESLVRGQQMLLEKFPKDPSGSDFREYSPAQATLDKFDKYRQAIQDPNLALDQFKAGYMPQESIEVLKVVYPAVFEKLRADVINESFGKKLTYQQKQEMNRVFGIKTAYYQGKSQLFNQPTEKKGKEGEFTAGQQSRAGKSKKSEESMTQSQRLMKQE